ncbi:MAG: hypothetical protein CVU56_27800 [Deltaproteobacteria bacterium HGW-Deltaproteobacteria-14]|nr:MAG: hypothetical protein CVU56_27800 [Deltaproteobacteria bacterium HGW-Deltaproteobacteria-14]
MRLTAIVAFASTSLLVSACGDSGTSRCGAANATQPCVCVSGASGAQTCQADGAWSTCQCGAATDTVVGGDAADASVGDTGGASAGTIAAIQSGAPSASCTAAAIETITPEVTLAGVVVTSEKFSVTANLDGYFVSDGTQAAYSGIEVVVPKTFGQDFHVGETVDVVGEYVEYYCLSEIRAVTVTRVGGATPPAPSPIANTLSSADLEQWEGVLVELSGVTVTGKDQFGQGQTDAGVLIDLTASDAITIPPANTVLTTLRGFVTYAYGTYRVSPRGADDLVADCAGSCDGKTCGGDGCGGSCGDCSGITACSDAGACVNKFAGEYPGGKFVAAGGCSGDLVVKIGESGYVTLAGSTTGNARCDSGGVQLYLNAFGNGIWVTEPNVISGDVLVQIESNGWGSSFDAKVAATISETGKVEGRLTGLPQTVNLGSGQSITITSCTLTAPWQ